MKINRKSIATVTAGLVAGGAIGFVAGVPGLTSAATDDTTADDVAAVATEWPGEEARASRIRERLQTLVDDATIDGSQADAVAGHLAGEMPGRVGGHGPRGQGPHSEVVTELLGIDAETLRGELAAGSTLAEVAEANGVSADDLLAALVAEAEAHITEHVEEGSLTEEEAAAKLTDIADRVSERVNSVAPAGGEGHGPGHRGGDRGGHRGGH